jgi:uncharacterized protein (DUF2164 family)
MQVATGQWPPGLVKRIQIEDRLNIVSEKRGNYHRNQALSAIYSVLERALSIHWVVDA